ncbi:radical SAM protein [Dactylosporangium darangshiense]|uniref:Radical SAM core domain-containing protein n=1 Tax=Dactylosporangium darangshiense TaxID=579108 RepID=A0ABP8DI29_9ACTN
MQRSISLLWALRSRCTRGCRYCYFGTLEAHRLNPVTQVGELSHLSRNDISADEAIRFARSLAGSAVRRVFLAGGEPLAWAPTLDVIEALKTAGVEVVVCTDGTALNRPAVAGRLLRLDIDAVSVSLDSTDATYNDRWRSPLNGRDGWHSVVGGVRALLAARGRSPRPKVGLYTVVTRLNLADVVDVPTLGAQLGCDYAVPQPVSLAAGHELFDTLALTPADLPELQRQYQRLYTAGLPIGLPDTAYPGQVAAAIREPTGLVRACFGGSTLHFVEPDGTVWDCPSALRIAATPVEKHRSIRGATGADLFPEPAGCPQDCPLFSTDCVCMWPLTGFDAMAGPPPALAHAAG